MIKLLSKFLKIYFLFFCIIFIQAQENNHKIISQLSPFLANTYFNVNFGLINYPFSNDNLLNGYTSNNIKKSKFSARILLGYKFREDFAVQFGVMRPASWVKYADINGQQIDRSVWINIWSLSFKKDFKLFRNTSIYGELGVGNFSRKGFDVANDVVYRDAHYATIVLGGGLRHPLNDKWDLLLNATYIPKNNKQNQPYVFQTSIGMQYNLKQIPLKKAEIFIKKKKYFFPKCFIQFGYASSNAGFFLNNFFSGNIKVKDSKLGLPIFWHGDSKISDAFSFSYQKTAFRTEKYFSLDWGVSLTAFKTIKTDTKAFAISIFPVLRFYVLRQKDFDMYLNYSVIGPTILSKANFDGLETGPSLTYQDFMGWGMFIGKNRKLNLEFKIMHYSNGNFFPNNAGIDAPLMFNVGIPLN
jgi:lipid A 3-O-deacylase PagL